MLTLVKICACSAAAVALSSPTPIENPAATSEVADLQASALAGFPSPLERAMQPTCQQCNFWAALAAAH